jgi:regulator of protease activity HflC (stomatin/prohibitin superfamily)
MTIALIVLLAVAFAVVLTLWRTVRIVPQAQAGIVERLGRYHRTLDAGSRSSFRSSTGCVR